MFDPINGPSNEFQGPSVGHSTENGDNWHTAVRKINAGFEKIIERIKQMPGDIVEAIDGEARKRIEELEDVVADLQRKYDALTVTPIPNPPPIPPTAPIPEKVSQVENGVTSPTSFTHTDASEGGNIVSGTATGPAV